MFNIGPLELIVILLVALLVVGPRRLPEFGRSVGKSLREFRRATDEVRYSFEASLDDETVGDEKLNEDHGPLPDDDGADGDGKPKRQDHTPAGTDRDQD
jgi:TatA/E family protein of Tat protein translocase